jgi:hypothetical protein
MNILGEVNHIRAWHFGACTFCALSGTLIAE